MKKLRRNRCSRISRLFPALAIIAVMAGGCAAQTVLVKQFEPEKTIHYSELKNWDETRSPNDYVVYVNPGDTIPLAISMDTDFMAFKQETIDIVAKQKLYFMIEIPENLSAGELAELKAMKNGRFFDMSADQRKAFLMKYKLYISRDAVRWASLYGGGKAYREVLGFKKGMISFGMMASTTEGLGAMLKIKTIK